MGVLPPRPCISAFPEMKTYENLYPRIYSFENLHTAYRRARAGKRSRVNVAGFEFDMEHNLLQLQRELIDQTYRPGPYHSFYIREPKRRLVSAAPFRDRVVHHVLCQVIEPIWERRFIHTSSANTRPPHMPERAPDPWARIGEASSIDSTSWNRY